MKTRMGTRYREFLEGDIFARTIRFAAAQVAGACLPGLTIYAVETACSDPPLSHRQGEALACLSFERAFDELFKDRDEQHVLADTVTSFQLRARHANWEHVLIGENAFSRSPVYHVRDAPVVVEFTELDQPTLNNSIRFHWRGIRDCFRKRLIANEVSADRPERATDCEPIPS